jgi:hypothetical protein
VTFDCQIAYLRNEWNKEPVFQLAMLGISSEVKYPFIDASPPIQGQPARKLLLASMHGPKTSAVKVQTPGCMIGRRASEANRATNTAIMATGSHEHQKGPG